MSHRLGVLRMLSDLCCCWGCSSCSPMSEGAEGHWGVWVWCGQH